VRSACFGGASDKRFPLWTAIHNGQQPPLAKGRSSESRLSGLICR
jgi:hypothetical protein